VMKELIGIHSCVCATCGDVYVVVVAQGAVMPRCSCGSAIRSSRLIKALLDDSVVELLNSEEEFDRLADIPVLSTIS